MRQNVYDNPKFFTNYLSYRENECSPTGSIEQPAVRSLLPNVRGLQVLDLGCGVGGFCQYAISNGASRVVGLDCSKNMCARTRSNCPDGRLELIECFVEDAKFDGQFDLVISSLMLHYVSCDEFGGVVDKIAKWVARDGTFIVSVNHPMHTAMLGSIRGGASGGLAGDKAYFDEGPREHCWLGARVVKHHRKLDTYVTSLCTRGFVVGAIRELRAPTGAAQKLVLDAQGSVDTPVFLVMRAQRRGN